MKKILISLMVIFGMLSTVATYEAYARTVLPEMGSHNQHTINQNGQYISLADLDSWYELFCDEKGVKLPSYNETIVRAGGRSSSEPYLKNSDIGKRLFETTLMEPSINPYNDGPFTNLTYGYYKPTEKITQSTPERSYILTEMSNNVGNHNNTPEQYAWWMSKTSNISRLGGIMGAERGQEFSSEAQAFEQYVLDVAGVNNVNQLAYTSEVTPDLQRMIDSEGLSAFENGGLRFEYPVLEYNPKWDIDVVGGEEAEPDFSNVTVAWDDYEQLYKVGPFSVNYIESVYKVTDGRNMDGDEFVNYKGYRCLQFAGISDAKLDTNIKTDLKRGDLKNDNSAEWNFLWIKGEREENDNSEFPHDGEEFYIAMKYIEDATEITNLEFSFRYMNPGGSYSHLEGTYNKAKWENKARNNYEIYYCGSLYCAIPHQRHVSTTYWIQLVQLESNESQKIDFGYIGGRWYTTTPRLGFHIPLFGVRRTGVEKARLVIQKEVVDRHGNIIDVGDNKYFHFKVFIDGKFFTEVSLRAGESVATPQIIWKKGTPPPTYEVVEITRRNGHDYRLVKMENATGTLSKGATINVYAENEYRGNRAKLVIEKQVIDGNGNKINLGGFFTFRVYKNGAPFRDVTVRANSSITIHDMWGAGEEPPTYLVEEINIPAGCRLIGIQNASGVLNQNGVVRVLAINEYAIEKGRIEIVKEVNGNVAPNQEFTFEVTIDGKTLPDVKLRAGSSWTSDYIEWQKGSQVPTYSVTEKNIPAGYKLVGIDNATGTLASGNTVKVIALNEEVKKDAALRILKTADSEIQDREFTFKVTVGNQVFDNIKISAGTNWMWELKLEDIDWGKSFRLRYEVYEYPSEYNGKPIISTINPSSGYLTNSSGVATVEVFAVNKIEHQKGRIEIVKEVNGSSASEVFTFEVTIDGKTLPDVKLSAGGKWVSDYIEWAMGDNAPSYSVKEKDIPAGYKLVSIQNAEGTLAEDNTITVTAVNEYAIEKGKIEIVKQLNGSYTSDQEFTFEVTIDGRTLPDVKLRAGTSWTSDYIEWEKGSPAPTYSVIEKDIPDGSKLVRIDNATGTLSQDNTVRVVAINELEEQKGRISVLKDILTDDKINYDSVEETFTILIRINGTFEINGESIVEGIKTIEVHLRAGETYVTPEIKWYGNNAPTYTISEIDLPLGWRLEGITPSSGRMSDGETVDAVVINSFKTRVEIDLTFEMAGKVWEDVGNNADKNMPSSEPNGLIDNDEQGIDGVEIFIYKVLYSGNTEVNRYIAKAYEIDGETPLPFPLVTESGGVWNAPRVSVPGLTDEEKDKGYTAKYDVEFVYDGQTYEPTKFLPTSPQQDIQGKAREYMSASTANRDKWYRDSMALDFNREEVDARVAQVAGDLPINGRGETIGKVIGTNDAEKRIDYVSRDYTYGINNATRKVSTVTTLDGQGIALELFKAKARTSVGYLLYPFDDRIHLESVDKYIDEQGAVQVYHYSATYNYTLNINLGLMRRELADVALTKDLYDANVVVNEKLLNYRFNSALMQLLEATGNQEEIANILNKQIEIDDTEIKYTLGLYETDFLYKAEIYEQNPELYNALKGFYEKTLQLPVESTELDVFLTYKISLYNQSTAYEATINEVEDYFDNNFTLVSTNVKKYIQTADGIAVDGVTDVARESNYSVARNGMASETGNVSWREEGSAITDSNGIQYRKMVTDSLKGVKLASGERIDIYVTFKVNKETYNGTIPSTGQVATVADSIILGEKHNIAEIANYSTYYSRTYHPEKNGGIAGKIDRNSAPSNINILERNEKSWYEDDTDAAPEINIELTTLVREVNGIAWDEKKLSTIPNGFDQRVGNGIREPNEFTIGGLTTQLVEKVRVMQVDGNGAPIREGGKNVYKEYDFIWPTDKEFSFLGNTTLERLTGYDSTTTTAKIAGMFAGLDVGQYKFANVPAGNYVVRFIYGDKEIETAAHMGLKNPQYSEYTNGRQTVPGIYNGQDYKTTTYQTGFGNGDSNGDGYIDNEWHDLTNASLGTSPVNDTRDDEARRLDVIAKSQIITNVNGTILNTANYTSSDVMELIADLADLVGLDVVAETARLTTWSDHGFLFYNPATHEVEISTGLYDYYMVADTAKLNIEIENTRKIDNAKDMEFGNSYINGGAIIEKSILGDIKINGVQTGTPVTQLKYIIENIDVGLVERSENQFVLDKEIEDIRISTSDGKTLFHAVFDLDYDLTYNSSKGTSDWKPKVTLNKEKSVGTDNMQALNKDEPNGIQNFRYINVDEIILQGATIEIGYAFTVLNMGEVDRVGLAKGLSPTELILEAEKLKEAGAKYTRLPTTQLNTSNLGFDHKTICGKYVGSIYYKGVNGNTTDGIVTTKVRQVIDYVDNDAVFPAVENTGVDQSWRTVTVAELVDVPNKDRLLDKNIAEELEDSSGDIIDFIITDSKGVSYNTSQKNNIILSIDNADNVDSHTNKGFIVDLIPHAVNKDNANPKLYSSSIKLATARYVGQETSTDDMNFDNIGEIVKFENDVGRRDYEAVPGNANPRNGVFAVALEERDSSATELITLTPPTGIEPVNVIRLQLLATSALALIIVSCGIIAIKKKVLK